MASRRATSETGAYMSQYDQEVEKRLSALEAKPKAAASGSHAGCDAKIAALEAKVDTLVGILKRTAALNIEKLSGGSL
tara:strand:- start:178 stop:411 length:234 start_codon:yes stop_codon:yes gene_type:complete